MWLSYLHFRVMWNAFTFLSPLFLAIFIFNETDAFFTNFIVKTLEVCNNTQRAIIFYPRITKENGKQYLTLNMTSTFPIGDGIGGICLIQTKTIGNNFAELSTVRENNFCKGINKYLGEFWYDIQRQSGLSPGVCPMQQGRYHGNHIEMQFEKISLQTFPFGTLRFILEAVNNTNKNTLLCLFIEVENIPN